MTKRTKIALSTGGGVLIMAALAVGAWRWHFRTYTPAAVMADIKAGIKARKSAHPFDTFMELRYGSMSDPANRRKAFLEYFDLGHMEGMQIIVEHMKPEERQRNIAASAQWLANYRTTMTPDEKRILGDYMDSDAGRAMIQKATAQYLSRDISYRAGTFPVISELMITLATVNQP